jgi:hypothetical protein
MENNEKNEKQGYKSRCKSVENHPFDDSLCSVVHVSV